MVAKISVGSSVYGALAYNAEKINKEKGRVLDTNKIYNDGSGNIDIRRAFEDFKLWMPQSCKAEKTMMHISLNPHPEDKLSEAQYTQLAHEYMEKMGFGDMPYLIVKHEDIDRHHIHIVALRVRQDGTAISTKNNYYRSKEITRELERKYGLHTAEHQKISPDMPITKIDPNGDIKRQVANTVKMVGMRYKFQTMGEYNAILGLYNVKCEQTDGRVNGREYHGLVYFATDDNGNVIASPFKASRLGKFASRTAIDSRFEKAADKIDVKPTKRAVAEVMAQSSGKDDFIARLKEKNIDLVLRYTDDGRIYGATYIDHNTKTVLNGSRLGKEFSANALDRWFNNPSDKPVIPITQPQPESQGQQTAGDNTQDNDRHQGQPQSQQGNTPQGNIQGNDFDNAPALPGLDLFQVGPGYDPEEESFIRAMRRRKKKKRRGPNL
ncbi:conjugal transfer protein MobB [Xylanibacter rodentium]|uniref:conjugal transfer protein MobB n=1 Tax=Xylanibacter rodentium TaxID=2736289 RepID=UPI0025886AEF|nr:conjugal transfer protein MobB [Xylanibacter rodentium]